MTETPDPLSDKDVTARYRRAVEANDVEAVLLTLAPDVVVHSPISDRVSFRGRDEMRDLFRAVFASVDGIHYFADVGDSRTRALFYRATVGGEPVEEATRLRLDDDQLVEEITLFFRPLPGLTALTAALAPRIARRRGRGRAIAARLLLGPLAVATRLGDRLVTKFV
ncbi:MAG: nuclear transport factor 2 family protein [Actinomycetota bacterium]|nr:nuclear transport factor 2 family protein [Actinomycetota bacterium]